MQALTVWKKQFINSPPPHVNQQPHTKYTPARRTKSLRCVYWFEVCLHAESTIFFIEIQLKKQKFISIGLSLPWTSPSDLTELINEKTKFLV